MPFSDLKGWGRRLHDAMKGGEAPEGAPPPSFSRYEVLEKLGEGAMADVYRATDRQLGRPVALKVLKRPLQNDEQVRLRFRREAQAVARLSHPNVVAIHDFGEEGGLAYVAMELVDGTTFDLVVREGTRNLRSLLEFLVQVARGVHHAHGQGVVHRDLKPGNILVSGRGEAKVGDFGLALMMESDEILTRSGASLGTPAYMSPEQVAGTRADIGPRTDVYALGVMLYEILTRQRPHHADSSSELYRKIREEEPVAPRRIDPRVPADLEVIALKAIEKRPEARYASAGDFADDLQRHLDGVPILARAPGLSRRIFRRLAKRRVPVAAGLGAAAIVAAMLMIFLPALSAEREVKDLWSRVLELLGNSQLHARLGENDQSRRRLEEGVRECRAFLERRDRPEARYFLARCLRAQGRLTEARAELDRVLERDPGMKAARLERGLLLAQSYGRALSKHWAMEERTTPEFGGTLEAKDPELAALRNEAVADLSAQLDDLPYSLESDRLFARAELLRLQGVDPAKVREALEEVVRREPLYVAAMVSLAQLEILRGRWDDAVAFSTNAIERHRGLTDAWLSRSGAWYWKARRATRPQDRSDGLRLSLEDADRACALEDATRARFWRGLVRTETGDADGAIEDFSEVLRRDEGYGGARVNRGNAFLIKGDDDAALADYDAALRLNPGLAPAWQNRARVRFRKKDLEGALADADRAVQLRPDNAAAHLGRALFRREKGDLEGALADGRRAVELDPGTALYHYELGNLLGRLGRIDESIACYDHAISADPEYAEAFNNRGTAKYRKGNYDAAIADFSEALRIRPRYAEAFYNRGNNRFEKGELDAAVADFTSALAIDPLHAGARFNRGNTLYRLGRGPEAIADYGALLEKDPDHHRARWNRALAREGEGAWEAAAEDYQELLRRLPAGAAERPQAEQRLEALHLKRGTPREH